MPRNFSKGAVFECLEKKQAKKDVFKHFLEVFDQKNYVFLGARSPLNISYIGAGESLRKFWMS